MKRQAPIYTHKQGKCFMCHSDANDMIEFTGVDTITGEQIKHNICADCDERLMNQTINTIFEEPK